MIKINNLCLRYDEKIIFDNLNLEIGEGITCIMAESGRGKTSLLRMMAGLLKADSGEIVCDYKTIGMCFQEDRLLPWLNALDNVKLVCDDKSLAKKCLDLVGLSENYDSMPKTLSGGEKRRVSLARTLAYKSDLLILDEPLKGLDDKQKTPIINYLKGLDKPIIIVSHSLDEAKDLGATIINL